MDLRLWLGGIEAEILQCIVSEYGHFHVLHRIHKEEEPVVLQNITSFQSQLLSAFRPDEIAVEGFQLPEEVQFFSLSR